MGVRIWELVGPQKGKTCSTFLDPSGQGTGCLPESSSHLIFFFIISLSILRGFNLATCYRCFLPVYHLFFNLFLRCFSLHPFLLVFGTYSPSFQNVLASLWLFFKSEEHCLTLMSSLKPGSLMDASTVCCVLCVWQTDRRWKFISRTITVFSWRKV